MHVNFQACHQNTQLRQMPPPPSLKAPLLWSTSSSLIKTQYYPSPSPLPPATLPSSSSVGFVVAVVNSIAAYFRDRKQMEELAAQERRFEAFKVCSRMR